MSCPPPGGDHSKNAPCFVSLRPFISFLDKHGEARRSGPNLRAHFYPHHVMGEFAAPPPPQQQTKDVDVTCQMLSNAAHLEGILVAVQCGT